MGDGASFSYRCDECGESHERSQWEPRVCTNKVPDTLLTARCKFCQQPISIDDLACNDCLVFEQFEIAIETSIKSLQSVSQLVGQVLTKLAAWDHQLRDETRMAEQREQVRSDRLFEGKHGDA